MGVHVLSLPITVGFVNQEYFNKSVANIPNDAELTPIHPSGDGIRDRCVRGSDYLLHHRGGPKNYIRKGNF